MASRKFGHEEGYRGKDLLKMLSAKQVVVCGAGALGSNLVDLLARQGVQKLRVIDFDRVEAHNVNTQLFGDGDVGALKVAALQKRVFRDTAVEVETFDKRLDANNIAKAVKKADLVIDAFDNNAARKLVAEYFKPNDPVLHGGMYEGYGEVVWNNVYKVPQDAPAGVQDVCDYPLARNLVMLVVTTLAEEALNFLTADKPRVASWSITLKDMKIQPYR